MCSSTMKRGAAGCTEPAAAPDQRDVVKAQDPERDESAHAQSLAACEGEEESAACSASDAPHLPKLTGPVPFGHVYLLTEFLKNCGWLEPLRAVFSERADYERLLAHIVHCVLEEGGNSHCSLFIEDSALIGVLRVTDVESLDKDAPFFGKMGSDTVRRRFLRAFAKMKRRQRQRFGKTCSTLCSQLPGNSSHQNLYYPLESESVRRYDPKWLVLILDEPSGISGLV